MYRTPPSRMLREELIRKAIKTLSLCELEKFRWLFGCTKKEAIAGQAILRQDIAAANDPNKSQSK